MPLNRWDLAQRTFKIWAHHGSMRLAAATAFYSLMTLAPLLVVGLDVLSLRYGQHAEERIDQQVDTFVGTQQSASPSHAIHDLLHRAARTPAGRMTSIISFGVVLVSGSSLFVCLQNSLNQIWNIRRRRGLGLQAILRHRIVAGAMVLLAAVLLLSSFALTATLSMIVHHVGFWISGLSFVADTCASFILSILLFASIFKLLPDVRVDWADVWVGATVAAILFIAGKFGLAIYFHFATMRSPYGAAGSLSALLIWIYYSAALMFLGACFTRAFSESRGKPIRPNAYAQLRTES